MPDQWRVTCPFSGKQQRVSRCPMCAQPTYIALFRGEAHRGVRCELDDAGEPTRNVHPCRKGPLPLARKSGSSKRSRSRGRATGQGSYQLPSPRPVRHKR